ncbi:hypothetical protein MN116_005753 [Schistosoma mekongi]|uniref:Proteasome assembly chaperone 1 n=1 Tax=Schistosoma mekongi TaxID=38744 RepID=A0AAE1ZAJ3_SCHME|nr:hypothetical protein MN116_005753 [Schistosoma mekongi]
MEYFLKRIPAFSRALGDIDSDSEDDDSVLGGLQNSRDTFNELPIFTNKWDEELSIDEICKSYKTILHVIVAIGPLTTAFVTIGIDLTQKDPFVTKVSCRKISLIFSSYYLPDYDNTLVICIEDEPKYLCYQHKHILYQYLDRIFCYNENFNNDKINIRDINVLCSRQVTQYHSKLKIPSPFIRCILTSSTLNSQFPKLEEPNILAGLPAEVLSWFYFKSLPVSAYIVFYLAHISVYEWSGVKEVLSTLLPVGSEIMHKQFLLKNEWDNNLLDEKLREMCITAVCNSERAKTDQMYT